MVLDFNRYETVFEEFETEEPTGYPKSDIWVFDVETLIWTYLWVPNSD